jgi:diguanylate cyclase (GGDEF)-like protein
MKRRTTTAIVLLILMTLLIPMFMGIFPCAIKYVNAEESETIRVGFCDVEGFITYGDLSYNDSRSYNGYYADYLNRISQITSWNYEYVELDNMEQGEEMLASREIDLLAPCQLEEDKQDSYDYSQYSFGTEYYVLVTKGEDSDIYYEDYAGMNKKVIGALAPLSNSDALEEYMADNNFSAEVVYYDNMNLLNEALVNGDIDLIWTSQMMSDDSQKIVARFSPYPFYFMTWKGNDDLLDSLNAAMQYLKNTYPGLENELLNTYFPLYNILYFTREEQEFIDELQPIKIAYVGNNTPISYENNNGELGGISRQIFDKIQEVSGLKFEYEVLPEGNITYDYLREQGFDLITGVRYNRSNLYSRGILLTNPYLSSKMVLVGDTSKEFDVNENYTVAVISGSQTLNNEIVTNYPNFTVVGYDTIEECFNSVRNGGADLLMTDRYIANYWLTKPVNDSLYILPVEELEDELCISVVVDIYGSDTINGLDGVKLVSIINKTLTQISQAEIDKIIIDENNNNRYSYTLSDFLYIYRYAVIIGVIAAVLLIILYIYTENIKNKARKLQENEAKRLELQHKRYQKMMDSSGEMLYDVNIIGETGFISEEIKKKFGWDMPDSVTDFTSEGIRKLFHIHPYDWKIESERILTAIDKNQPSDCLVRIISQNGEEVWSDIYFYPLLNEDNEIFSIIGKIEDVDQDIKEKNKLRHESETDQMTGLMNKNTFEDKTKRQIERSMAYNSALLFVDLDHFKMLNDTLGHSVGDEAIQETATRLQKLFANVDLISRFGGDEFCIFVWNIPKAKLIDKLERLITIMHKTYSNGKVSVDISASVGVVYCRNRQSDFKSLLNMADTALYEAKDKGRNRYIIKEL